MNPEVVYIIGQAFGIVAILLGFLSFQMKTQGGIILAQAITAVAFIIHYFLIGAMPGAAMNIVSLIRSTVYYFRNKKGSNEKITPIAFTLVMAVSGILTWDAWYSVFFVIGLELNTVCMSLSDPQKVRASILVSSPLVFIYDAFTFSIGGMIYESVVIASSFIGILRNSKKQ